MASGGDAREIMGMPAVGGPVQPPPKKVKVVAGPRVTGMKREIQDLQGDHAPPIPLTHNKYKSKPAYMNKAFKPRPYELRPFQNNARTDGLVFRHWKRKRPESDATVLNRTNGEDSMMVDVDSDQNHKQENRVIPILRYDDEFPLEKYNIKVDVPTYTDDEYEQLLKSDDWTKEETTYLMELCQTYDLRWFVIGDRYEKQDIPLPPHIQNSTLVNGDAMAVDSMEIPTVYPDRSLEDLKARYYFISSTMIEKRNPQSNMNEREWKNWDLAARYDRDKETQRKRLAESLFARSEDEATEEKLLLAELKRILKDEDDWLASRQDITQRLDFSPTKSRRDALPDGQENLMERSSAGLSLVLQQLLTKERANKGLRRPPGMTDMSGAASNASSGGPTWEKGHHPNQYSRRNTMQSQASEDAAQTPTTGPQKKGSMVAPPSIRQLTPAEEAKYGVAHPAERMTSGVSFRNERAAKIATAKSQIQTQKIQGALAELGVPVRLVMPTERTVREFEVLVGEINLLLEVRKHAEKVRSEIAVYEGVRKRRLAEEGGQSQPNGDSLETDKTMNDSALAMDADMNMEDSNLEAANAAAGTDTQDQPTTNGAGRERPDENEDEDVNEEEAEESKLDQAAEDEDEDADEQTKRARRGSSDRSYGEDENDEDAEGDEEGEDGPQGDEEEDDQAVAADEDSDEDDIGQGLGEDNDEVEEDEEEDAGPDDQVEGEEEEEEQEQDAEDEAEVEAKAEDEDEEQQDSDNDNEDDGDDSGDVAEAQPDEIAEIKASDNEADETANTNDNDVAVHSEDGGEEAETAEEQGPPRTRKASAAASAVSAVSAIHKRSASVVSEASRAGSTSNRSAGGRKRRK